MRREEHQNTPWRILRIANLNSRPVHFFGDERYQDISSLELINSLMPCEAEDFVVAGARS